MSDTFGYSSSMIEELEIIDEGKAVEDGMELLYFAMVDNVVKEWCSTYEGALEAAKAWAKDSTDWEVYVGKVSDMIVSELAVEVVSLQEAEEADKDDS